MCCTKLVASSVTVWAYTVTMSQLHSVRLVHYLFLQLFSTSLTVQVPTISLTLNLMHAVDMKYKESKSLCKT